MRTPHKLQISTFGKGIAAFALTATLAMTAATAQIASGTTGIDATGNSQSEANACNSGMTQQDRETCLREVRNANAEKRAGKLGNSGGQFEANAVQRCDVLMGQDKIACEARVAGVGDAQGSVAGGGVIRESETVVVPKDGSIVNIQPQTSSDMIIVIPAKQ